jgi:maleate isomerase
MSQADNERWRRDGWSAGTRLGVLTPHADVGPESELQAMSPDEVTIHSSRVAFGAMATGGQMDPTIPLAPVRAFAEPPFVDDAAELLAAAPLSGIGFGFTSSAYVIGAEGEAEMVARLQERTGEIPLTATCAAAVRGLRTLSIDKLMLISPPWFDEELDSLGAAYFSSQGFEVVRSGPVDLPSDQRQIEPADLYEWVQARVPETADAVFIGGNGFRSVGTIHALEAELDRPVLSANQALLWDLLRLSGSTTVVDGYGQLFAQAPPPTDVASVR